MATQGTAAIQMHWPWYKNLSGLKQLTGWHRTERVLITLANNSPGSFISSVTSPHCRYPVSQLLLIGPVLTCLEVTFSRMVLIGQVEPVSLRGMMGSDATAHTPRAHQCKTFSAHTKWAIALKWLSCWSLGLEKLTQEPASPHLHPHQVQRQVFHSLIAYLLSNSL